MQQQSKDKKRRRSRESERYDNKIVYKERSRESERRDINKDNVRELLRIIKSLRHMNYLVVVIILADIVATIVVVKSQLI